MNRHPRVLLVDGLEETRDVLEAVFSSKGVVVDRLKRSAETPISAIQPRPEVVVLHGERLPAGCDDVPRIVIGRVESRTTGSAEVAENASPRATEMSLSSPFEYEDLVGAIESLL